MCTSEAIDYYALLLGYFLSWFETIEKEVVGHGRTICCRIRYGELICVFGLLEVPLASGKSLQQCLQSEGCQIVVPESCDHVVETFGAVELFSALLVNRAHKCERAAFEINPRVFLTSLMRDEEMACVHCHGDHSTECLLYRASIKDDGCWNTWTVLVSELLTEFVVRHQVLGLVSVKRPIEKILVHLKGEGPEAISIKEDLDREGELLFG